MSGLWTTQTCVSGRVRAWTPREKREMRSQTPSGQHSTNISAEIQNTIAHSGNSMRLNFFLDTNVLIFLDSKAVWQPYNYTICHHIPEFLSHSYHITENQNTKLGFSIIRCTFPFCQDVGWGKRCWESPGTSCPWLRERCSRMSTRGRSSHNSCLWGIWTDITEIQWTTQRKTSSWYNLKVHEMEHFSQKISKNPCSLKKIGFKGCLWSLWAIIQVESKFMPGYPYWIFHKIQNSMIQLIL